MNQATENITTMNPTTDNTTENLQQEQEKVEQTKVEQTQETANQANTQEANTQENTQEKENTQNQEPTTAPDNNQVNLEKLQAELNEYKDKYLRLYADFENFRRRNAKEKADLIKYASENVIKPMLIVLDDFERALKTIENDTIKEGIQLVFQKFSRTLEQSGLKPIETKQGDDFDTEKHESITQIPAPTPELKGKVVDVVEKGYYLQDKIIRFAKVIVGS